MAKIGEIIDGKYEILKEVGRGGMSIVYLAMDNRLNKQWAIKEIKKKGTNSENQIVVQSLMSEANMMKKLDHPNLPRIVDIIEGDNTIYIAMDYIEGEPLDKILKKKGAQPQEAVIQWGINLAEVLDYLHTRQPAIIYRDMKPANIMLRPDGSIKLFDFGIAREYKEENNSDTVSLGTKGYAAPEQFGGMGQTDARTDVYGLGVTLYHLVTGKNPCEPPYEIEPIRNINPSLSSGLEVVIQRCTRPNPDERFQSCAEVLYALNHLDELDGKYRKKQKRKLNGFIASVVLTLLMAIAGTGTFIGYKTTLSQTVNETIELYGSNSASGGDLEKLYESIERYASEVSQEKACELITNYMDVFTTQIGKLAKECSDAVNDGSMNDDKKKEFDSRETAMFNELDKIVENQIPALDTGFKDEIYYQVGEIYLNYYKCSEGKLDDTYIKNRNEEAAQRFAKISETYDAAVLRYTKGICSISNVEKMFSKAETGFSDNENTISEENKIEAWDSMAEAVSAEERYANKVNLYLIVGDIVYGQREEFRVISDEDKKNEIIEFCQSAVSYLNDEANVENVKSSSIESINMKRDKAKTYYEGIYEALAQKEMEG